MRRFGGWLLLVLGGLAAAFGLMGGAIELEKLLTGTAESPIFGFVMSGVFFGGGAVVAYTGWRLKQRPGPGALPGRRGMGDLEPRIFRLAGERGGRLSPGEVSAALSLPFDVCRHALESLAARDACQVVVTADGATLFRFPELEGPEHRRDLLEG